MFNRDIRNAAKEAHVFLWQIADRLKINDGNFSRKLKKRAVRRGKGEDHDHH